MACSKETFINHGVKICPSLETQGRGLFTTRSFKNGETIIEEQPLFSCQFSWNYAYGYSACDFCMRPLETAEENARRLTAKADLILPHPECDGTDKSSHVICSQCAVTYCSVDCKDQAWNQYHKTICCNMFGGNSNHPLEKLNEAWKKMHYPPETSTIMLLVRILANFIQRTDREELKSQLMSLCHHTVNEEETIAHKLLGQEFESQLELLRDLCTKALGMPETHEFLTPQGFRSLIALIGRNGQGIGTSAFSVWVRKVSENDIDPTTDALIDTIYQEMENESGDFLNNEGSALFAIQSACNHSCEPNCISTFPFSNHTVALVASKDLEEGEEIFISYLDECAQSRSRHSRRKILKENYLFHCNCSRCQLEADEPDMTSEDEESMEDD
ncbi:SET and MYND domain-containing 5 protein [Daphnia pulex]|uniref:SET and MYND domain-containing 5 protein n=1 Tax=Daphnia pulex TaxID=6669 RepID=E9FRZ2_DAPPU|nr:SET and MYND domain-containing 5 protein [Daphnia pulex]|eukprot:EFX89935.1 SET and MYND domain-containing 5 protein [Daphnia pulex]